MSNVITVPFTTNYLQQVVAYIHEHYVVGYKDLSRLGIVFGGRRPALFIKRDLARLINKPFISPKFYTIDDWMARVAYGDNPQPMASEMDHGYLIYQLAMRVCPGVCQGRETFAQFLPWAKEILRFIEQLDLEDVPLDSLEGVREHASIGYQVPADINRLLGYLTVLRQGYHDLIEQRGITTRGYQYLQASRRVKNFVYPLLDEIIFCNFFYLHRTENAVIKGIFDQGKVVLLMQGDQRRWPALERIAMTFGTPVVEGVEVKPTQFDLKIYEAFDSLAQAGLVKEILEKIPDLESAVIVLPNPDFLMPLLTAVGRQLGEFNVSMGYPLKRSALYALLSFVIEAQLRQKEGLFYARDYLRVLHHPLVANLQLATDPLIVRVLVNTIDQVLKGEVLTDLSGRLFIGLGDIVQDDQWLLIALSSLKTMQITVTLDQLKETLHKIHQVLFINFECLHTTKDLARALDVFVSFMQAHSTMGQYPFNTQIALRMQDVCVELSDCTFAQEQFTARDLFKVLQERISGEIVAFTGSPLRGLQILGLFETRALNFEHVIVVDVNEGVLPNLNIYEPLIPREVMIKLNLDRLELEEEIQRYGFMRLIAAAKQVHLIYQHNTDRMRSRFVEELIWEQEQRRGAIGVVDIVRPAFSVSVARQQKVIPKTPAMVAFLKNFTYSASSINAYMRNPYAFYCQYVLGLRPKDNLLDDPQHRHIGIFIHDILQEAFTGFIGKKPVVDDAFIRYFKKIVEARLAGAFGKSARSDFFLMETVLKTRLDHFLQQEAMRCATSVAQVLYIERKFEAVLPLAGQQVRLTYRVDRVDQMEDGTILVLDYKTGGADAMPKGMEILNGMSLDRVSLRDHVRSFQMPLYVHYLHQQFPGQAVNAALYPLRTMSLDYFLTHAQARQADQVLPVYLNALDALMGEIFNLNFPFVDAPVDIE